MLLTIFIDLFNMSNQQYNLKLWLYNVGEYKVQ